MKLVRLPTNSGSDWWIIVHNLTLSEGRLRELKPIHVFTHLSKLLVKGKKAAEIGELSLWLENKLFGVRYYLSEFKKLLAVTKDPIYRDKYVRDYDNEQKVICALEAYLNSIYTSLEIASQINRILYPALPMGFRKQSKKFNLFDIEKNKWIQIFLDVRSEIEHYSSSLPLIEERSVLIKVKSNRNRYSLNKGKNPIPFAAFFSFSNELFNLLDKWANLELKKIDQNKIIDSLIETGSTTPLQQKKIKAKEILNLLT